MFIIHTDTENVKNFRATISNSVTVTLNGTKPPEIKKVKQKSEI